MPLEDVLTLGRAKPFEPFRLHLDNGARYDIRHPEQMIPLARSLIVGVGPHSEHGLYFERADRIALMNVSRLESL